MAAMNPYISQSGFADARHAAIARTFPSLLSLAIRDHKRECLVTFPIPIVRNSQRIEDVSLREPDIIILQYSLKFYKQIIRIVKFVFSLNFSCIIMSESTVIV